jgi:hypothetical protein
MSIIYTAPVTGYYNNIRDTTVSSTTGAAVNITDNHRTTAASKIQRRRLCGNYILSPAVYSTSTGKFIKPATGGNPHHHSGDDYPRVFPS